LLRSTTPLATPQLLSSVFTHQCFELVIKATVNCENQKKNVLCVHFLFVSSQRYALRALKSFRPSAANASLERWRDVRHPAVVALQQAFWTDQVAVHKQQRKHVFFFIKNNKKKNRNCKCGLCMTFILGPRRWRWLILSPQTLRPSTRMFCGATFVSLFLPFASFTRKALLVDVFIPPRSCSLERFEENKQNKGVWLNKEQGSSSY
jgi:hypothetical protein